MVAVAGPKREPRRPAPARNGKVAAGARERLLSAARAVFAERGYERATVEEIVRRARSTKGAFYHYFPSKEDLFLTLLAQRVEEQLQTFRRAWNRAEPVAANAQRVVERFVRAQREDPVGRDLQIQFWAEALRNERVRARMAEMYAREREFLVDVAAREVPADLMPIATPHLHFWASLLIALQDGLALQNRIDPQRADLEHWREHLAGVLLAVLDRGMPPTGAEATDPPAQA